ncbi:uncharacterized protein TNCV_2617681 [Trichonephila clavipes]|nr:uncharacterized protein TNCV_2617681 [Trichonephila clavipes]
MKIDRDGRRTYRNCDNCLDTELTPVHIFDCPTVLASLQELEVLFSLRNLYGDDIEQIARTVIWTHDSSNGPKTIAVVPDFHKRILFSDEAHFWLNGYVNKQNCRLWSEANPQVYVEIPLHPEKLTAGCALWAGGILLQKR